MEWPSLEPTAALSEYGEWPRIDYQNVKTMLIACPSRFMAASRLVDVDLQRQAAEDLQATETRQQ